MKAEELIPELATALTTDVLESVQGMIDFMQTFLNNVMEGVDVALLALDNYQRDSGE